MPEMIPGSRFLSGNPVNVVLHWVLACTRCYDLFTELDSREYGPIRSLCASALYSFLVPHKLFATFFR